MMAFAELEPFGALAAEFCFGQVAATVANVNRDAKQTPAAFTADDFMPALAAAKALANPPMELQDAQAQSDALDRLLFAQMPKQK